MACSAPVVTMISSGSVGRPRAQYLSAMASRRAATPMSSMPMLVQVWRHVVGRIDERLDDRGRRGGQCGGGEAHRRRRRRSVARRRCHRQGRGAAGAAAGVEIAVLAQLGVRGGDRGAGDPQRVGERPLAGQPRADGQASVDDQQPDGVGQALVGGTARDWTCASCRARGPKGPHRALARPFRSVICRPVCTNWLLNSKPVGQNYRVMSTNWTSQTGPSTWAVLPAGASAYPPSSSTATPSAVRNEIRADPDSLPAPCVSATAARAARCCSG